MSKPTILRTVAAAAVAAALTWAASASAHHGWSGYSGKAERFTGVILGCSQLFDLDAELLTGILRALEHPLPVFRGRRLHDRRVGHQVQPSRGGAGAEVLAPRRRAWVSREGRAPGRPALRAFPAILAGVGWSAGVRGGDTADIERGCGASLYRGSFRLRWRCR